MTYAFTSNPGPRLCLLLFVGLGSWIVPRPIGGSSMDDEPPSAALAVAMRALTRSRDYLNTEPLALVLSEETSLFERWIQGLRDPERRDATLAGIALEDASIAERISDQLPEGELGVDEARELLTPIVDQVRGRVDAALGSHAQRVVRAHERVLGKLEDLAPSRAPGPWADREDAALRWIDVRTATLALVNDTEQLPDEGGTLQVQVKLERLIEGVEGRWGELEEWLTQDLKTVQRLREKSAREDLDLERALRDRRLGLFETLGTRVDGLGPVPTWGPRESMGVGLARVRAGDREAGLLLLREEGPYGKALAHGLASLEIEAYNDEHAGEHLEPVEVEILRRINGYRTSLGRHPLEVEERLVRCAREHTVEMVTRGYFSHESPLEERRRPKDRASLVGYPEPDVSEMIYYQDRRLTAGSAFDSWRTSPVHHRLMVDERVHQAGVGRHKNQVTAVLGRAQR